MQYEKSVLLKNNKECCIRNAVGDDAQEVLDIFLLTHEQTDFLASYRDEATFDTAFERQFLADRERADREVYLCAVVDGHIVGTAGVDSMGSNKIRHRAELGGAVDSKIKGKKGLCILSSKKKRPFLADPKFLKHKGFTVCDEADNGIQLWCLSFDEKTSLPKFKEGAKHPHIDEIGYVLYYTNQCPFNAKYVPVVEEIAKEKGIQFKAIHLQSKEQAQNAPTPITTYALFYNGEYLTNEQMNDKRFLKLLEK